MVSPSYIKLSNVNASEISDGTINQIGNDAGECHLPLSAHSPRRSSKVEKCESDMLKHQRCGRYAFSRCHDVLHRIVTKNLISDQSVLDAYRRLCHCQRNRPSDRHESLSDVSVMHASSISEDGGLIMIKLVKLWIVSVLYILVFHELVRKTATEIDPNYSITDFFLYDFPSVIQDLLFFFLVGRLYSHSSGVDVLFPWGIFISLGAIYPSFIQNYAFLRHSLSLYEIICNWPAVLFLYVAALLVIAMGLGMAHVYSHYHRGVLGSRIAELAVLVCIFMAPYVTNDSFHLHHWYGMWLLGMIANAPEWWSTCLQAYCLGSYINGIAVYGRDPILGCMLAFYRSTNADCSFMECYQVKDETEHYKDFVAPDWRTCDAGDIVP